MEDKEPSGQPTDAQITLLDTLLRYYRREYKSIYIASLDVSKAFDSISHVAIESTLVRIGIPAAMTRYLGRIYSNSRTRLEGKNWTSTPIHPQRGVRQGDPLSPIIFNVVIHKMLQQLPQDVGGTIINAKAYADNLLLFASTQMGLQQMIDQVHKYLRDCGMSVNIDKSMTITIKAAPHEKKNCSGRL